MKPDAGKLRNLMLLALFICFSAVLSLRMVPKPPTPGVAGGADGPPWSLPSPDLRPDLNKAYQTLTLRRPWEGEGEGIEDSLSDTWYFRGVVQTDEGRLALIETANEVHRYRKGDTLPGGGTVKSIRDDVLEVQTKDGIRVVRLYRPSALSTRQTDHPNN